MNDGGVDVTAENGPGENVADWKASAAIAARSAAFSSGYAEAGSLGAGDMIGEKIRRGTLG